MLLRMVKSAFQVSHSLGNFIFEICCMLISYYDCFPRKSVQAKNVMSKIFLKLESFFLGKIMSVLEIWEILNEFFAYHKHPDKQSTYTAGSPEITAGNSDRHEKEIISL